MTTKYQLWYRDPRKVIHNILANPDLADGIDYVPYRKFQDNKRQYCDFMSGNWAWRQCVSIKIHQDCPHLLTFPQKDLISVDIDTHGAMFIPILLGSDKTTVSVATGQ